MNSVLESLGSVALGRDVSDAAGLELGHVITEKWEGKRRSRPGRAQLLARSWPIAKLELENTFLFQIFL
jgi:hypothetical protein